MNLNNDRFVPNKNKVETFYLEHIQRYDFSASFVKGKKILDLGCGSGYGSARLLKHKAKEVTAVDIDPRIIKFAKKNYPHKKISFQTANATNLPFKDNEFDVVTSFEVIEHIKNYRQYLREVFRVLKPYGYFIFSTPNKLKYRAGTSAYHFKEFSALELKNLFKKYKCTLKLYGQFFEDLDQIKAEKTYFTRYNTLTLGGNKHIKKILNIIPTSLKVYLYKLLWDPLPQIDPKQIKIKDKNLSQAITLIGIIRKTA